MNPVIIIGGGAGGLAAAIAAASLGDSVLVLERMNRVGKKLLATGNGRCNLMNTSPLRYPNGAEAAGEVLSRCGVREQTAFWHALGLRLREEEQGRVYPISGQASTVLDVLRMEAERLGVMIRTEYPVEKLEPAKDCIKVSGGGETLKASRVIVAGGGCAQPKLGSDGSCFALLRSMGHTLVKPRPALTQIVTEKEPIRGLSGIRVRGSVTLTDESREVKRESGEMLFTDYGISGICAMQLSGFAEKGFQLHLSPEMGYSDADTLYRALKERRERWPYEAAPALLTGLCVPRLAEALCRNAGVSLQQPCGRLKDGDLRRLAAVCFDLSLTVQGVHGFENAQVTAGGIDPAEFDLTHMASRIDPRIHAAGEVLNVDGDCGGFNLMFAFGSGILAGLNGRQAPWRRQQ